MKFQARPLVIDAIQYTGDNFFAIREFLNNMPMIRDRVYGDLEIRVYHDLDRFDLVIIKKDNWVFKDATGSIATLSDETFKLTYEAING